VLRSLEDVSTDYQRAKAALQQFESNPEASVGQYRMRISLPESTRLMELPNVLPTIDQVTAALHATMEESGESVVRLWAEAHQITGEAVAHCDAAAAIVENNTPGEVA
jgi:hypothetical protein